jgi:TPR repeat protein
MVYHRNHSSSHFEYLVGLEKGAYFLYVAKMYLYGLFDNPLNSQLQQYRTGAPYLAAYLLLRVAAEEHQNAEAYYWLGLLEQFKLVPDRVLEGNLAKGNMDRARQVLQRHLKTSHLNNGEHNLYMAASLGFSPAALVLGHMNREPFGTSPNCTAALGYYLAVLKQQLFEPYSPKLVVDVAQTLEEELFARKKLVRDEQRDDNEFVVETGYFDEETISATLEQANRFYTGSRGVMRDLKKALRLYEKLSEQGNNDGRVMAGLMHFRGEGTPRNVGKAKLYFEQTSKDEISEFMLLAIDYFEILVPGTKEKALKTMHGKVASKKKQGHLLDYLIGSAALRGELKEVNHDQAVQMIDRAAADGNPSARILMAILFADGAKGLKYGCTEATKYLSEDAAFYPYFTVIVANTGRGESTRRKWPCAGDCCPSPSSNISNWSSTASTPPSPTVSTSSKCTPGMCSGRESTLGSQQSWPRLLSTAPSEKQSCCQTSMPFFWPPTRPWALNPSPIRSWTGCLG